MQNYSIIGTKTAGKGKYYRLFVVYWKFYG